ncbi:hypothetical protein AVEN_176445-2-1, partial [Araneus ventricosus]
FENKRKPSKPGKENSKLTPPHPLGTPSKHHSSGIKSIATEEKEQQWKRKKCKRLFTLLPCLLTAHGSKQLSCSESAHFYIIVFFFSGSSVVVSGFGCVTALKTRGGLSPCPGWAILTPFPFGRQRDEHI